LSFFETNILIRLLTWIYNRYHYVLQVTLEQYPTSPHLTASVVLAALQRDDLGPGRSALDLGCGTGMLALGCALVDCDFVLGVDCDEAALQLAVENVNDMEMDDKISFILAKLKTATGKLPSSNDKRGNSRGGRGRRGGGRQMGRGPKPTAVSVAEPILSDDDGVPLRSKCVDTVLCNPPFGTKNNAGMDVRFLRTATRLAKRAVYSFHKTSTRDYLVRKIQEWGMKVEVVAEMRFELPQTYKFHKEKSVDIEVDLIRVLLPEDIEATNKEEGVERESEDEQESEQDST
jgi:predicted RNA methylase